MAAMRSVVLVTLTSLAMVGAFVPSTRLPRLSARRSGSAAPVRASLYEATIEKPMGIVFEDNAEGGLYVVELADGGAASASGLIGSGDQLVSVGGTRATGLDFDAAMGLLGDAPSPVTLTFFKGAVGDIPAAAAPAAAPAASEAAAPEAAGGPTTVTLVVDGKETTLVADEGAILRNVILDAKGELYNGMMDKAMNCGGAGQCGTCKVDVMEASEGSMGDRTPVEDAKLNGWRPSVRLACQTVLTGGEVKVMTKPKK